MSILDNTPIDVTDVDFDSLRARLYNLISSAFPDWTDQSVANFGNILVELFSHVGDMLGFYIDNRARESRITQATQRSSVIALAKLLGYTAKGATAATTTCTVTMTSASLNNTIIPAGTVVRTKAVTDPIKFQTLTSLTIPGGSTTGDVDVEHSTSFTETFPSTGLANQTIRLSNIPFLDDTEVVSAANGSYSKVNNFLSSLPTSRHYTIKVDQADKATIQFGNGISGQVPSGTISVDYKTGGGAEGNVTAGAIAVIEGSFADILANPVTLSVTNATQASGGRARESVQSIQLNAPESLRALTRTVSREDFEINAKRVSGVSRALMMTSNEYDIIQENEGTLFIVPSGGGTASTSLLNAVRTMITTTYPHTVTFRPTVISASYLDIDVQATVHFRKGVSKAGTKAAIVSALTAYYAVETVDPVTNEATQNTNVDFGYYLAQDSDGEFDGTLALSDIMNVVRDTTGVRKLGDNSNDFLVNGAHSDLAIAVHQFPRLRTVIILDAETGTPV